MGRIPDEDVQRVREATELAEVVAGTVVLKKKGRLLWGCCPFHAEKTPSFKVDPVTQLWHCFGCGAGGDVFGFVMRVENLDFPEAVRALAERARIEIREEGGTGPGRGKRDRLIAACDAAAAFYHRVLVSSKQPGPTRARDYLASRGFGLDVAKRWEIGFAPGGEALARELRGGGFTDEEMLEANLALPEDRSGRIQVKDRFRERIVFPIRDVTGKAVGFGGRVLGDGQPKYLNTGETPLFHKSRHLYGIDRAKAAIVRSREAVVVEGYTDVIALHEAGLDNVVATLGTALTPQHTKLLGRFTQRVVCLFDGDEAGVKAALRAADIVDWAAYASPGASHVEMAVALIPGGRDPADLVRDGGAEALGPVLGSAVPLLEFVVERRLEAHDLTTPEGRSAALASVAGALAAVRGSMMAHDYERSVAGRLFVDPATVRLAAASSSPDIGSGASREEEGEREAAPAALLPESAAEREAVRLIAAAPSLRARATELVTEGLVTSPVLVSALRALGAAGATTGAELVEHVRRSDEAAAQVVAGMLVMDAAAPEKIDSTFRGVLSKLKETALERRIHTLRGEMKVLGPTKDRMAYDRLFARAADLQRELDALRRAVRAGSDDTET